MSAPNPSTWTPAQKALQAQIEWFAKHVDHQKTVLDLKERDRRIHSGVAARERQMLNAVLATLRTHQQQTTPDHAAK